MDLPRAGYEIVRRIISDKESTTFMISAEGGPVACPARRCCWVFGGGKAELSFTVRVPACLNRKIGVRLKINVGAQIIFSLHT